MAANGSARAWNPAWRTVLSIRSFFTWGLVLAVGGFAIIWIAAGIIASREAAEREANAKTEEERRARLDAERRRIESIAEAERKRELEQKEIEKQKLIEERARERHREKETRTAKDAAHKALSDF